MREASTVEKVIFLQRKCVRKDVINYFEIEN